MRFAFTGSLVLVGLVSITPAFGQAAPVKEKAGVPDSAEVTETAREPQPGTSPEKPSAAPETVAESSTLGEAEVSAASAVVPTEPPAEEAKADSGKTEKASEIETKAGNGDEPEEEEEKENDSDEPGEPAAPGATEAPPKSDTGSSEEDSDENVVRPRTGFVFAPRLGLTVGGATHIGIECEETGDLGCGTFGIRDHKEASGFGIAADALYGLIPELRLGATLMWLPQAKGDAGGELRKLGTEVQLQAVAEGVFDLVDRVAVTVRVQGGGSVLAPTGFVDEVVKEAQDDCEVARDAGVDCTVHDGPYFAPVFGGGAGILVQTKGAARLRLDFLYETQTLPLYEQKATSDGGTVQANITMDQSRFWLLGGFEI